MVRGPGGQGKRVFSATSTWVTRPSWTVIWMTPNRRVPTLAVTTPSQSGVEAVGFKTGVCGDVGMAMCEGSDALGDVGLAGDLDLRGEWACLGGQDAVFADLEADTHPIGEAEPGIVLLGDTRLDHQPGI